MNDSIVLGHVVQISRGLERNPILHLRAVWCSRTQVVGIRISSYNAGPCRTDHQPKDEIRAR